VSAVSEPISPAAGRDYLKRFALVAARQRLEQTAATLEQKLDDVERLMLSVDDFGWREALDDDAPIRARWALLRERLQPGSPKT
ncbi:MAG TPA: hypothetical protein VNG33_21440, partial [Polyangiaceae bacterium]|nr:hypothetical protein [Polyangiaceae bacterium]